MKYNNILTIFVFLIVINTSKCSFKDIIKNKVNNFKEKAISIYEGAKKNTNKQWEFEIDNKLSYPRGDKQKLKEISFLWASYYECSLWLLDAVLPDGRLPAISLMVYVGAVAHLPCNLCISPAETNDITWWYADSIKDTTLKNFEEMEQKETTIEAEGNVTIYHIEKEDAGVYFCKLGDSNGSLVFLEVVDHEEPYNVVKPESAKGPHSVPPKIISNSTLTLLSQWSKWSECSRCGRVGRRRRFGPCYIVSNSSAPHSKHKRNITMNTTEDLVTLNENTKKLFQAFPEGLPCRSKYLPKYIRNNPTVQNRRTEIMIGLCKVVCKENVIFELRTSDGRLMEAANNSAGVYSLLQPLPAQPPQPARDIVFAEHRSPVNITCPGTILTEIPATWKIGTHDVVPRDLDRSSGGRIYVSARDQLVFSFVKYTDTNLYSCWQDGQLAGTIKLEVWKGGHSHWNHHLTLIAMLLTVGVALRVSLGVLRNHRKKIGIL